MLKYGTLEDGVIFWIFELANYQTCFDILFLYYIYEAKEIHCDYYYVCSHSNLANQKWLSHFGDLRWNDPKSKRVIKW